MPCVSIIFTHTSIKATLSHAASDQNIHTSAGSRKLYAPAIPFCIRDPTHDSISFTKTTSHGHENVFCTLKFPFYVVMDVVANVVATVVACTEMHVNTRTLCLF